MQETGLNKQLHWRQWAQHAQIIYHEESVHTQITSPGRGETTRRQIVAMHVKVRQAPTVRMKLVQTLEGAGVPHYDLSIGGAGAQYAVAGRGGRGGRGFDDDAVLLLVANADLTQHAEPLDVKVVDELGEAAKKEPLLSIEEHALQILEGDLLVSEHAAAEACVWGQTLRGEHKHVVFTVGTNHFDLGVCGRCGHLEARVFGQRHAIVGAHATFKSIKCCLGIVEFFFLK